MCPPLCNCMDCRTPGNTMLTMQNLCCIKVSSKRTNRTSLVVGWIGICLQIQGTWVHSLVWKDSTYHGATKACGPQLLKPVHLELMLCNKSSRCSRSLCTPQAMPACSNKDPAQPKINKHKQTKTTYTVWVTK